MRRLGLVTALTLLAATLVGSAGAEEPKLRGSVGPGFAISLRDASGAPVTTLQPGAVELEVEDKSPDHNFHLTGPGVDVATTVDEVGSQTFALTLQDGRYTFVCDVHPLTMKGSFTVGTTPPPPPPTGGGGTSGTGGTDGAGGSATPPPSAPVGSRLVLTSGPGPSITLRTTAGRKVTRLRPGPYVVVVRDRSATHDARLRGAGAARGTSVRFVGTQTWRVVLRKGTLVYLCDAHPATMRGTVRVG